VKKLLVISATVVGLALSLLVQSQAQEQERVRSIPAGRTPLVADALVNGPVPRLPDGKPDLTGPWVGGGSDADIEHEGGLKPGELPLLPWAKELRDKREKSTYEEPYIYCLPMSVPRINPYPWKFAMSYTSKGLSHIYILHETGDASAHRVVYTLPSKRDAESHLQSAGQNAIVSEPVRRVGFVQRVGIMVLVVEQVEGIDAALDPEAVTDREGLRHPQIHSMNRVPDEGVARHNRAVRAQAAPGGRANAATVAAGGGGEAGA
jgi:hypothetical protein